MKFIIAFFFAAFFAGFALAQDQTQNQPAQPQSPPQGWYQQSSGVAGPLEQLFFKNRDSGWIRSGAYSTISTTNGGNTWQVYSDTVGVLKFIGSFAYGTTIRGGNWLAITTNNGETWKTDSVTDGNIGGLYFSSPLHGLAVRANDIAVTFDGAKSWIFVKSPISSIRSFVCFDSLNILACGGDYQANPPYKPIAGLALTTDGGKSWSKLGPELPIYIFGADKIDAQTLVVIGNDPFMGTAAFRSTNRGNSWKKLTLPPNMPDPGTGGFEAMTVTEQHDITAVGGIGSGIGLIVRSTDSGTTWIKQNCPANATLYDVAFADSLNGWAVGEFGTIIHTTNSGYSWVSQQIPQPLEVRVIPQPFATKTTLSYSIPKAASVDVKLYDVLGKEVYHITSNGIQSEGVHSIEISGEHLPGGVYYFILTAGSFNGMGKVTKIVP
jgi:photosystem II stability/assembly factor-like uncharacterized protein